VGVVSPIQSLPQTSTFDVLVAHDLVFAEIQKKIQNFFLFYAIRLSYRNLSCSQGNT